MSDFVIFLVGRTGDGKSTVGNEILTCLGNSGKAFLEGDSAKSTTHVSLHKSMGERQQGNVTVVDNPGLMDSDGLAKDEENIRTIVAKAKVIGHLNVIVLVVNWKAPRFDDGMQSALKVIADSLGRGCLNNLVIVYTNVLLKKQKQLDERTDVIREMINERCSCNIPFLTYYPVENHPEEYVDLIGDEAVGRIRAESRKVLEDLIRLAKSQKPYSTVAAVPADYEHVRLVKEAQQALAENIARLETEKRQHMEAERLATGAVQQRDENKREVAMLRAGNSELAQRMAEGKMESQRQTAVVAAELAEQTRRREAAEKQAAQAREEANKAKEKNEGGVWKKVGTVIGVIAVAATLL